MKYRNNRLFNNYLITVKQLLTTSIVISSVILTACGGGSDNNSTVNPGGTAPVNTTTAFTVPLSSLEIVPIKNSTASASGQLSYDSSSLYLNGSVTIRGTSSPVTFVHLHDGIAGSTGGAIVTLVADAQNSNLYNIPQNSQLSQIDADKLLSGATYLQVHTMDNGMGELRGQVLTAASTIIRVNVPLSGLEVVNINSATAINTPVNTTGSATAVLLVDQNTGDLYGGIRARNLIGTATMSHIHDGAAGTAGGVLITFVQDNVDSNLFSVPANSSLNSTDLAKLLSSNTYVQVHSSIAGGVELRGQVLLDDSSFVRFSTNMDGAQVASSMAPIMTNATGQSVLLVNNDTGAIFGGMSATNLQGVAGAGHIHEAAAGSTGGVVVTFVQDVTDKNLYSIPLATILIPANLTALKADNTYVQIHSSTFGMGEIRGQILNP